MFENREGQRVPDVTFRTIKGGKFVDVTTNDLFAGKKVAVFSLPGAFTPTCSSSHVPRYNELADALAAQGIQDIICLSVNDGFVMDAWAKDQHAERVTFIADGNGDFTEGMGLLVDKTQLGFGKRSWRYSMIVNDGVVEKMFIEPNKPGDPYEVSDADTMLEHLAPGAAKPSLVTLFAKEGCPHCARAKKLLTEKGYQYEQILVGRDVTTKSVRAATGASTVPQVFIDGKLIGSADQLEAHFAN